jgi:hypothetical protein
VHVTPAGSPEHEAKGPECQEQQEQADQRPEATEPKERERVPKAVAVVRIRGLRGAIGGQLNMRCHTCIVGKEGNTRDSRKEYEGCKDPEHDSSVHFHSFCEV